VWIALRGNDQNVWVRQLNNGIWGNWIMPGAVPTYYTPTLISDGQNRVTVLAHKAGGQVMAAHITSGVLDFGWTVLAGSPNIIGAPTAASRGQGTTSGSGWATVEVVAAASEVNGTNCAAGLPYYWGTLNTQTMAFSGWQVIYGCYTNAPTMVSKAPGTVDYVTVSLSQTSNKAPFGSTLWWGHYDGSAWSLQQVNASTPDTVSVSVRNSTTLDVFHRDNTYGHYVRWLTLTGNPGSGLYVPPFESVIENSGTFTEAPSAAPGPYGIELLGPEQAIGGANCRVAASLRLAASPKVTPSHRASPPCCPDFSCSWSAPPGAAVRGSCHC
jgi:hypothetical protein